VITTRTVQSKRSRQRLLLLVGAVKGNRLKYLYFVLHQDFLTVLLEEIRHWGEATRFVFLVFLHQFAQLIPFHTRINAPVTLLSWSSVTKCSLWGFDLSRLSNCFPFMIAATSTPCCRYMAFGARSVFIFPSGSTGIDTDTLPRSDAVDRRS
jgi:hypothetical protein